MKGKVQDSLFEIMNKFIGRLQTSLKYFWNFKTRHLSVNTFHYQVVSQNLLLIWELRFGSLWI